MPGDDADFAAYLAARWPSVVRTLVLLGCGRCEAAEVAQAGLARCYGSWERVRRGDDVDAFVYVTVLGCLHHRRHRSGTPAAEPAPVEELTDGVLLRQALEVQLAGLAPEEREVLALHFVAGLSEAQVGDVLDVPVETVQSRITYALSRVDLDGVWAVYQ